MKPRNEQLLKMLILKIERIGSFYNELDKKERATNLIKDDLNKTSMIVIKVSNRLLQL
jgi:hypothetical protein